MTKADTKHWLLESQGLSDVGHCDATHTRVSGPIAEEHAVIVW